MTTQFYIILNIQEKPKFDAHIQGVLLDNNMEVLPVIFNKGKSLNKWSNHQFFIKMEDEYSKPGKFRDKLVTIVNSTNPLLVVSKNLELLLNNEAPDDVEFFNLTIKNKEASNSDYKIANIIHKIDCIDYNKSDLNFEFYDNEEPSGDILGTNTLVINEDILPMSLNIFLLGRYKENIIVVRERLKEIIQEQGISGVVFCKVEDFQN